MTKKNKSNTTKDKFASFWEIFENDRHQAQMIAIMFDDILNGVLSSLTEAFASKDIDCILELLHKLKGTVNYLSFHHEGSLIENFESKIRSCDWNALELELESLKENLNELSLQITDEVMKI